MVVAVKKLKPEGLQGHKEWLVRVLFPFPSFTLLKHTLKLSYFQYYYSWSNS